MSSPVVEVVIAKFAEDLGWLKTLPAEWRITVYSKLPSEPEAGMIQLPNIGREAHTYLWHIRRNYFSLADVTLFLQGNPLDHAPHLIENLKDITAISGFKELSEHALICDSSGLPWLPYDQVGSNGFRLKDFYQWLLERPCPALFCCRSNALFAVTAERVRVWPLSFYEKALSLFDLDQKTLKGGDNPTNPLEAHFFERIWHEIFRSPDSPLAPGDSGGCSRLKREGLDFCSLAKLHQDFLSSKSEVELMAFMMMLQHRFAGLQINP